MKYPLPLICIPIIANKIDEIITQTNKITYQLHLLELRLDYVQDLNLEYPLEILNSIVKQIEAPKILTLRPLEQGGAKAISPEVRIKFWKQAIHSEVNFFDIEFDIFDQVFQHFSDDSLLKKIIVSFHDFYCTPDNLAEILKKLPNSIFAVKIATQVNKTTDLLKLWQLQEFSSKPDISKIVIGMGSMGSITRILGPAYGAPFTYSTTVDNFKLAPGQFTLSDLTNNYKVDVLNRDTCVTGLIGKPVHHSLSPYIHNTAFHAADLNWVYIPTEIPNEVELENFLRIFVHPKTRQTNIDIRGYSITMPYKIMSVKFADRLTETAQKTRVINTLIVENNELIGDNTDVEGFIKPLKKIYSLKDMKIAILGAGGTARSVAYALIKQGAQVSIFARNLNKAIYLKEKFGIECTLLNEFDGQNFDGLVNTTPIGMNSYSKDRYNNNQTTEVHLTENSLSGLKWVYDLIYRPTETCLIKKAKLQGIRTLNGLEMLVEQAALQFESWTKHTAPINAMKTAVDV